MADGLSEAELSHILANREPYPDATDLIAIRDELAMADARLAEISGTSLKRLTNRNEIAALQGRRRRLGTAEIVAREHVTASPVKAKIYATEMSLKTSAGRGGAVHTGVQKSDARKPFDREAFERDLEARRTGKGFEAGLATGIDED